MAPQQHHPETVTSHRAFVRSLADAIAEAAGRGGRAVRAPASDADLPGFVAEHLAAFLPSMKAISPRSVHRWMNGTATIPRSRFVQVTRRLRPAVSGETWAKLAAAYSEVRGGSGEQVESISWRPGVVGVAAMDAG